MKKSACYTRSIRTSSPRTMTFIVNIVCVRNAGFTILLLKQLFIWKLTHNADMFIISSSLKTTDRSFRCASPCLWNQLPLSLRKPHSGTSSSISCSPIPSPITSASSDSPLCTSITPSLFHLKPTSYTNPTPLVSLLPPGLPPRTFACTVSPELLGFWFLFFHYFSFLGRALD